MYERPDGGVSIVSPTGNEDAAWIRLPEDAINPHWVDESDIPTDRTFRNALLADLSHDISKAKLIAHEKRRIARTEEFAPLDIKATIPTEAVAAEAARQSIRDKYKIMQIQIDAATSIDELKTRLP